jgi:CheY-like chemotaxis protein
MVWNRRARKSARNRVNPPSEWVWSPQPVHPPIVSREEYETVAQRAAANGNSRRSSLATATGNGATRRTEYLYRGRLRCGICGLRMTGNIRNTGSKYYFCYPHKQRSTAIPPDHPPTTYLSEPKLHEAITGWLSYAIFGPDRADYWHSCLVATHTQQRQHRAPVADRLAEIESQIADLSRRLQRQIINLEADDITTTLRRQITARIADLDSQIATRQTAADALCRERDDVPQDIDETADALARLPHLAAHLADMPQPALRRLYDALDLQINYQPAERAVDVQITLTDAITDTTTLAPSDQPVGPEAQVCSVPPAGFEPAHPPPEGGALSPELRGRGTAPGYQEGPRGMRDAASVAGMAGRTPRVLVVDDEAVIRQLIVINLELEGFEVHQAADGLDALDKAREVDPDVVTLDVMMPGLDGWATAQRLRADPSTRRARIVFISARTRPADVDRGLSLGAEAYLTKPFDPEDVIETVRRLAAAADGAG